MFKLNRKNGVSYYTITSFEETGLVKHGFSTREGGVSDGCYSSMNFRFHCDDTRENVLKNFEIMADTLGMDYNKLVLSKQVHEDVIHTVTEDDFGNGIVRENKFESVDALITDKKGIPMVTLFADCVPLFFLDKKLGVACIGTFGLERYGKANRSENNRKNEKRLRKPCGRYFNRYRPVNTGMSF